jgi:hypothetical protein
MIQRWSAVWKLCVAEFIRRLARFGAVRVEMLMMVALQDI